MRKYQLFFVVVILYLTTFCTSNCTVCTISIQNNSSKIIDSVRIKLNSENEYSFLIGPIPPKNILTKNISQQELKLGRYFSMSSIIYSGDSSYSGPNEATDMVFGEEKYKIVITDSTSFLERK